MSQKCSATCRDGSPCGAWAVIDEDKCRMHLGTSVDGKSHESNDNAETHSLRSDPGKYYERQSSDEQARIDEWAESWARRGGYNGLGFDKMFKTHATKLHQIESADAEIADNGVVVTRIVERTETGTPIKRDEENPAFLLQSRALKDILRFLKDFGCLDDPDSQRAVAQQDIADAWRGAISE